MKEVQEAAKIITESIDPDAKVIFGAFKDDGLSKNSVRVTVIATGFDEDQVLSEEETSVFDFSEEEIRDQAEQGGRGQFSSFNQNDNNEAENKLENFPSDQQKNEDSDDPDNWGAVPAFLRRSQKKQEEDE